MPDLNEILIGGIAIAPLVVGIVNLAKRLGLPADVVPYFTGAISAALWVTVSFVLPMYPEAQPYAVAIVGTIVVFLGASGIHQFGKVSKK